MADVTISYKNNEIATMNATGVKTLLTGDTFCEDDIVVAYTKPSAPAPTLQAKTNISPTTSSQTITADNGYDGLSSVQINAMPSGSATTPATTITANPSISVSSSGLITASNSKTQSVTPTVSAGYVSSGTAGTITVSGSNTKQLTTQAAQTLYPSTSDQTITSGKYLTGTQTFKGVLLTNLTAENIKKDVVVKVGDSADDDRITSVTGTYEGSGGGGGPDLPDPSTVTDLTNTTWLMNNTLDTASLPNQSNAYDVLIQTGTKNKINQQLVGGYVDDYRYLGVPAFVPYNLILLKLCKSAAGVLTTKQAAFLLGEYNMWYGADGWGSYYSATDTGNGAKVWTFLRSGGGVAAADNTNANLITWMKNNATLINID